MKSKRDLVFDLLTQFVKAFAQEREVQQRFRTAVTCKLCAIEAIVGAVYGAKMAEVDMQKPEKAEELLEGEKSLDAFIDRITTERVVIMAKYIHALPELTAEEAKRLSEAVGSEPGKRR